jgi:hypothetical protein
LPCKQHQQSCSAQLQLQNIITYESIYFIIIMLGIHEVHRLQLRNHQHCRLSFTLFCKVLILPALQPASPQCCCTRDTFVLSAVLNHPAGTAAMLMTGAL